ncbi:hypothetical protein ILUMI_24011 [Ignelater luminosus]|uniref:PiggyBac transposable element-derived protein domain-containing protein n=1 Tax=Ignelater luminosus TaxID=2038154 RepID=A0A8K0C710_IGNLU|nr:hypothetical protein ILUMI_24011 [Ignelater luminosus]
MFQANIVRFEWGSSEVLNHGSDQVANLLAEILSDPESIDTDSDSDDNIFVPSTSSNKIQVYTDSDSDVESVSEPSISLKKETTACNSGRHSSDDEDPVSTVLPKSPTSDVESSDYDSEDNVPSTVVPIPFVGPRGPSIPDNVEYSYEAFLALFTEDKLVDNIVFQTNLYATTPTTEDEMLVFLGINILMVKPLKTDYKVWARADISGFVNEFQICTGKIDNVKTETALGERDIRDLTISLTGKYHRVLFDNYFSLVSLLAYLQENKIYGCETVRANHSFLSSDISADKILRREETDWTQATSGILYTKWKDQRCINFLSNFHNLDLTNVNRRHKDGSLQVVPCL